MKRLTVNNLKLFWDKYRKNIPDENDVDSYIEFMFNVEEALKKEFDLPHYIDEQTLNLIFDSLLQNDFTLIADLLEKDDDSDLNSNLNVFDYSNSQKEWNKTPEIYKNLNIMIDELKEFNEEQAEKLIAFLQQSNDEFRLKKGTICCPRKYVANSGRKLPAGVLAIEIRINSKTSTQYRVYGILHKNNLYLLSAYTKNSGQEKANANFDSFMDKANDFIENQKLLKEELYYISEDFTMKYSKKYLEDYNKGRTDAFENNIKEQNCSNAYLEGYDEAKQELREEAFKNWYTETRKRSN